MISETVSNRAIRSPKKINIELRQNFRIARPLFSSSTVRGYIRMIRCLHVGKAMFQPEQEAEIELD